MTHSRPLVLDELDAQIEARLVGSPMSSGRRLLGIELERLVLHRETQESAPLEFCRQLLADLVDAFGAEGWSEHGVLAKLRGPDFGISLEPGGQLEVDAGPCADLDGLEVVFRRVTQAIEARLAATPYTLFAFGHAPRTRVADLGLLPRPRYRIMDKAMPERGALARHMMRATAGTQLTCDFADREDAGRKMALTNRLVPVLTALTANSRLAEGADTGYASFRHRVWWETDPSRCGIPEGALDADTAVDGYVRFARRALTLFVHRGEEVVAADGRPFEDLVAAGGLSEADLQLHLSSLFPFVRLRNYLELRCFDTVRWTLAKGVLALVSGVVYCPNATAAAWDLSEQLAIRDPAALREFHIAAARDGLDASVPGGPKFRDLAGQLLDFACSTLGGPDCTWGSTADLDVVRQRIDAGD
ncbi:MAG: glutamate-cysteine ligase family protein [Planctomycetota bacterium]